MAIKTFPITLTQSFMITPKVKHFVFHCEQNPPFQFTPGQFITIHFQKDGKTLRRSYSIANVPRQDNTIEFAAGYVENGPGTELLFNLNPGDTININGPFGRLTLKDEPIERYILVATSTGITPYRSMLPELKRRLDQKRDLNVVILQGVQKQDEVLYEDEFLEFSTHPQAQFYAYLSRESGEGLKEHESTGYVQSAFPMLQLNPEQDIVYLCGNPAMIDESFAYLKEQGFSLPRIIREKYISAK